MSDNLKDLSDKSEANSIVNYNGFDESTNNNIRELARTYSRKNSISSADELKKYFTHMSDIPGVLPMEEHSYAELDPNSPDFNSKYWVKNLRKLIDLDPEYYRPSKLGIAYKNLRAFGIASDSDYQPTVFSFFWKLATEAFRLVQKHDESRDFDILKSMDAIMKPGELTVVLGRPGSGCSTLLKTISAHTYGFNIDKNSVISYDGLTTKDIENHYRGDVIYSAETDSHFPHLSVGDTLEFAARLRTPQNRGPNVDREEYAQHVAAVYMATYGLSHTRNTAVGNDFIRGVSGGERKRVSIAEASLSGANIQCWDNATRGLDSATALEFIRALKTSAAILQATPLIAIYQCSQDAYDLFDNTVVLYEGYQIYYGKASEAKNYFINMGYDCPQRQTTADYLTSLTNPDERIIRKGFNGKLPNTPAEFEQYWKNSPEYSALINKIDNHINNVNDETKKEYHESHVARQSNHVNPKSPYTVSFTMQVKYIVARNFKRMKGDPSVPIVSVFGQVVMALVLSSVFYNLTQTVDSFYYRGAAMFFAVLFNAFASLLEIMSLFEARPIVEKHKKYALYRPSADAFASIISELPVKMVMSVGFNFIYYFMVNFRRNPGRFFFYWLCCFLCTLTMSHLFRSIGAVSTSLPGAMTPATVLLLAMVIYTGFVIPFPSMLGWSKWIKYINPVGYVFESLMVNEFHNRPFECLPQTFVPNGPGYENVPSDSRICSSVGSEPGSTIIQGTRYLSEAYDYTNGHKWRNIGIVIAFVIFFLFVYISLCELNKGSMQKGEIALFLRGSLKKRKELAKQKAAEISADPEKNIKSNEKIPLGELEEAEKKEVSDDIELPEQDQIFHWRNLTYQVKIKSEDRVILNHVNGWVKPGQLTALMGSSGAGKTTLLNCLSERVTSGIISDGTRMVNGHQLDNSFQRSIGYCQQQDLHLPTNTVREALLFSAYLRQPNTVSKKEKEEYVEYIIDLLEMWNYADALVGVAGEGLNVEQRKRLTIGVELVAKPKLLLFLDEPTSGLDSQTAWSICKLLRKLANHGQAILCTIHQPSAILLQEFDRLLFLQAGGKTVYFGDLGENCSTLISYFERNGAHKCPEQANPAEWMLEVVGAAPGSKAKQDYFEVWTNSEEARQVDQELDRMETELVKLPRDESPDSQKKYATPFLSQLAIVTYRVLLQNWRSPTYIYSKVFLVVAAALFNGFSFFKANKTQQGLQNQMFAIFMTFIPLNTLIQQMLPYYIRQREIYEIREAPSRSFSWVTFILAQIASEMPAQIIIGTLAFLCWFYPVGLYENAVPTDQVNQRAILMWMFIVGFYVYVSTLGHACGAFNESDENAANIAVLLFTMCLNFCGVLAGPDFMPRFWIFMYRANPFTYLVQGILSTGLANSDVICSDTELLNFNPVEGQTCGEYMSNFIETRGGYLISETATENCQFCTISSTNTFLASVNSYFNQRWRNYGIFVAFIFINIILTVGLYWLARVPKGNREKKKKKKD